MPPSGGEPAGGLRATAPRGPVLKRGLGPPAPVGEPGIAEGRRASQPPPRPHCRENGGVKPPRSTVLAGDRVYVGYGLGLL